MKKRFHVIVALAIAAVVVLGIGAVASAAGGGGGNVKEALTGLEETPALSTSGIGEFRASVNRTGEEIKYTLTFGSLESDATQAHIHFENATNARSRRRVPVLEPGQRTGRNASVSRQPAARSPAPSARPTSSAGPPRRAWRPASSRSSSRRSVPVRHTSTCTRSTGQLGEIRAQLNQSGSGEGRRPVSRRTATTPDRGRRPARRRRRPAPSASVRVAVSRPSCIRCTTGVARNSTATSAMRRR